MTRPIVDARLASRIGTLLLSTCTIRRAITTSDTWGQGVQTWTDLAVTVPCQLAAGKGRKVRDEQQNVTAETDRLYLPAGTDITERDRVVFGGITYDVTFVDQPAGRGDLAYTSADLKVGRV